MPDGSLGGSSEGARRPYPSPNRGRRPGGGGRAGAGAGGRRGGGGGQESAEFRPRRAGALPRRPPGAGAGAPGGEMEPAFGERGQPAGLGRVFGEPQPRLPRVQRSSRGVARSLLEGKERRARGTRPRRRPA